MHDPTQTPSLINELDALHDDVLQKLDDLNQQIEQTLKSHSQKQQADLPQKKAA